MHFPAIRSLPPHSTQLLLAATAPTHHSSASSSRSRAISLEARKLANSTLSPSRSATAASTAVYSAGNRQLHLPQQVVEDRNQLEQRAIAVFVLLVGHVQSLANVAQQLQFVRRRTRVAEAVVACRQRPARRGRTAEEQDPPAAGDRPFPIPFRTDQRVKLRTLRRRIHPEADQVEFSFNFLGRKCHQLVVHASILEHKFSLARARPFFRPRFSPSVRSHSRPL